MDFGCSYYTGLYTRPVALPLSCPGHAVLELGQLHSHHPVLLDVADLAYLDQLESAIQALRAAAIVSGIPLGVTA
jgi:hypothetical protein